MLRRAVPFTTPSLAYAATAVTRRFTHQPMATDAEKILPAHWDPKKKTDAEDALNAQTKHEAKHFTGESARYAGGGKNETANATPQATASQEPLKAPEEAAAGSTRLSTEDHTASRSDGSTRSDKEGKQMYAQMAQYDATHRSNK